MKIRRYRNSDWESICNIHDRARKNELFLAGLEEAFIPLEIAAEREGLFDYSVIVAENEEKVCGFCAFTDEELAWLYVDPDKARKGIGTELVNAALKIEPEIYYIEVLCGNEPAKCLYEKFGFKVKKTATGKMPGNEKFEVSAYCMEKEK